MAIVAVAVACVILVRHLDLPAVAHAFAGASLPLLAAAAAVNLVQVWQRSLALKAMLAPVRAVGVCRLARYNFAMYAGNNLFPGRAGEVVRVHLLRAREGVPPSTTVAVALVEKVFDGIALLLLALPVPLLFPTLPRSAALGLWLLGAGGLLGLLGFWAIARYGLRRTGRSRQFAEGAQVVRRPGPFAAALGLSLLAHATDGAMVALCMAAVGIHFPPAAPLLVLLGVAIFLAVPSTPSGIGALEIGAVLALRFLGVAEERAFAFAILYHLIQLVPVTVIGLLVTAGESRGQTVEDEQARSANSIG